MQVLLAFYWCRQRRGKAAFLKLAAFLAAVTPVGANICVFAQKYDCDYEFSVITMCLSTILGIASVPALAALAQSIL